MKLRHSLPLLSLTVLSQLVPMQFAEAKQGNLTFCASRSPSSLSPATTLEGTVYNTVSEHVYDRLFQFKIGTLDLTPSLAESYTVTEGGKVITLKLRKNVKWQSNKYFKPKRDFNADDVMFTFNRQLDPNHYYHKVNNSSYSFIKILNLDKLIDKIEKVDDYTVRITLTKVDLSFIKSLGMDFLSIYSKEYADALMKKGKPEYIDSNPIGTGPFQFVSHQKDVSLRYIAFSKYWRGKANIQRLTFSFTPDAAARVAKIKTGACDIVDFPNALDLSTYAKDPNIRVTKTPGLNVAYIAFNTEKKPFDDVRVRQALYHAVNRADIRKVVYGNLGVVDNSILSPGLAGYSDKLTTYEYNPAKAKKLLAAAGYPNGFETEIWVQPVVRSSNPSPQKNS